MVKAKGILCKLRNDGKIELYDVRHRTRNVIKVRNRRELRVGRFYVVRKRSWRATEPNDDFGENVTFRVVEGALWARTWAVRPRMDEIEEEGDRDVWRQTVWSPFLGFLRIRDNELLSFEEGERRWVDVKYKPSRSRAQLFKIVDVLEINRNARLETTPPWRPTPNRNDQRPHPSTLVRRGVVSSAYQIRSAVCVGVNVPNLAYNKTKAGSLPTTNEFFSLELGLYRCFQGGKLGKWYDHSVNDDRRKTSRKLSLYNAVKATFLTKLRPPPLPTTVRGNNVRFEIEAQFHRHHFVDSRSNQLKTNVYVWDRFLGRIEIPDSRAEWIVNTIEKHRNELSREERVQLQYEAIFVTANVKLRDNYRDFRSDYPRQGFFIFRNVQNIKYKRRGLPKIFL